MTQGPHLVDWREFPNDLSAPLKALTLAGCDVVVERRVVETSNALDDHYRLRVVHGGRELVNAESSDVMGLTKYADEAYRALSNHLER
ncbi:hypothetical protein [Deinococcus yavapaiensis]|uniref:Uncharacterized protein n=1 Tax=Deinococcus yavapaiensis KR-236 TaxID=694435 RepID=A0A318S8D6_9DEIO|nr:hypothetical protein [Deinococcus yavapaiensis]PYE51892.1 hypothetical protein DES52_11493 [Deinococcus yavapaiensis KR-236]